MQIADGQLRGDGLTFSVNAIRYCGRIKGNVIEGIATSGGKQETWRATRAN
jgi:hypothetical protein